MNKKLLILLHWFVAPYLFGMEQKEDDKALVMMNEVFKKLDEKFVTSGNDIFNLLIKTTIGRALIMQARLGEIMREYVITQQDHLKYCASSNIYADSDTEHIFYRPQQIKWVLQKSNINMFIRGIASVEEALIENPNLNEKGVKRFEDTRIHDLFLLSKSVELDNLGYVNNFSSEDLLEELLITHKNWPPKNFVHLVNHFSSYQVLKMAVEVRKNNKIDAKDESKYYETWPYKCGYLDDSHSDQQNQ